METSVAESQTDSYFPTKWPNYRIETTMRTRQHETTEMLEQKKKKQKKTKKKKKNSKTNRWARPKMEHQVSTNITQN